MYNPAVVMPTEFTVIQVGNGASPEVFIDIGQVTEFDGPETEAASVAKTHLTSPAKEYRPSLIPENGELDLTIELNTTNAQHIQLESDVSNGVVRNYQLVWNNGTNSRPGRQFAAFVQKFGRKGGAEEENITVEIVLKITGPITNVTVPVGGGGLFP